MRDPTRPSILVVDDCPEVLRSIERFLALLDCEVLAAGCSESALEIASEQPPDLLVLDRVMPGMDGLELLSRMRRAGVSAPAIIVTGYPTISSVAEAFNDPACRYIGKPFDAEELISHARELLGDGASDEADTAATEASCDTRSQKSA